jgi:hypothetical protein
MNTRATISLVGWLKHLFKLGSYLFILFLSAVRLPALALSPLVKAALAYLQHLTQHSYRKF